MGRDPRETPKPSLHPALPRPAALSRSKQVPYKVVVALFPHQWDELKRHVESRSISGSELVSTMVNDWLLAHKAPPATPEPEIPPDDEGDVEVSQLGY